MVKAFKWLVSIPWPSGHAMWVGHPDEDDPMKCVWDHIIAGINHDVFCF